MTLSAQDLVVARKAYAENYRFDQIKKFPWWMSLVYCLPFVNASLIQWRERHWGFVLFSVFYFFVLLPFCLVKNFRTSRNLKSRYADNLRLLDELRQKAGGVLPKEIENNVFDELPEEHPLLERWSHRLGKRAILWRLNAFLSRKRIDA